MGTGPGGWGIRGKCWSSPACIQSAVCGQKQVWGGEGAQSSRGSQVPLGGLWGGVSGGGVSHCVQWALPGAPCPSRWAGVDWAWASGWSSGPWVP